MQRRVRAAVSGLVLMTGSAVAQADASAAECALLRMTNQVRAQYGLAPLAWDSALARAARVHAQWVVNEPGELEHEYPGEPDLTSRTSYQGARFGSVAENLARGGRTPEELQQVWMHTPVHRANILSAQMTAVGIGVIERGGLLYAVEDFSRRVAAPRREQIEGAVRAEIARAGIGSVKTTEAARASCGLGRDAGSGALLVVAWDGSDPTQLPEALVQQISGGRYHSAAVGACPSTRVQPGFTTYRVTVLLY